MTIKETAIKNIKELPDSLTWANIIEGRIRFLSTLDISMDDTNSNKLIPHENVKENLERWLSK